LWIHVIRVDSQIEFFDSSYRRAFYMALCAGKILQTAQNYIRKITDRWRFHKWGVSLTPIRRSDSIHSPRAQEQPDLAQMLDSFLAPNGRRSGDRQNLDGTASKRTKHRVRAAAETVGHARIRSLPTSARKVMELVSRVARFILDS
jgi:hypothetical protein